jgi:pilus assembly protein Flp/PilA
MKTLLIKLLGDKAGASAAEYALILAVIGAGVVGGFQALGTAITGANTTASAVINP